jgi:molybdopterin/thiamine biosynthesis adenylyltransferase
MAPDLTNGGRRVIAVGLGNIGSYLVPLVSRLPEVDSVTLVDHDRYDPTNVAGQDIRRADVGRYKVSVQSRRLAAIRPDLKVETWACPLEHVPLGALRGHVLLTALDSRAARQTANRAALFLGMRWIDAGVNADHGLARISLVHAGPDRPCLECSWDESDYRLLSVNDPCIVFGSDLAPDPIPTAAPAQLGALAASMQALELARVLRDGDDAGFGRHVMVDGVHHNILVSSWRRHDGCRATDHGPMQIEQLQVGPRGLALDDVLGLHRGAADHPALWVPGVRFVRALRCSGCGRSKNLLRLRASLSQRALRCADCKERKIAHGGDLLERLDPRHLPHRVRSRSLAALGLRPQEVFGVGNGSTARYFELAREGAV